MNSASASSARPTALSFSSSTTTSPDKLDSILEPDAIASTCWNVMHQYRSAWSWEVKPRPWVKKF
jgi:hypothetical protein